MYLDLALGVWHGNKEKERQEGALQIQMDELGMMNDGMLISMKNFFQFINELAQVFVQKCKKNFVRMHLKLHQLICDL